MKYKLVIIDDEKKAVDAIRIIIEEFIFNCQIVGLAYSAKEGAELINKTKPDLVLLDIEMPIKSGFDMLELLPDKSFETIFVTAYNQYAIKAIKFSAFDYLLKPVSIDSLKQSIERFIQEREKRTQERYRILESLLKEENPSKIALSHAKGTQYVDLDNILYFKSDRSYITVFIKDDKKIVLSNRSLSEFEIILNEDFLRIHKSYLINLRQVEAHSSVDGGIVIMSNKDEILLSRRKKDIFFHAMQLRSKS